MYSGACAPRLLVPSRAPDLLGAAVSVLFQPTLCTPLDRRHLLSHLSLERLSPLSSTSRVPVDTACPFDGIVHPRLANYGLGVQ